MTQETIVAISAPSFSPPPLPPLLFDAELLACEAEEAVEELVGSTVGVVEVTDLIEVIQDDVILAADDIVEAVVLAGAALEGEVMLGDVGVVTLDPLAAAVELDGVATLAFALRVVDGVEVCDVELGTGELYGVVLEATSAADDELLPLPLSPTGVPPLQSTLHDCTPAA